MSVDTSAEAVKRLREFLGVFEAMDRGTTHWDGCEQNHARCMLRLVWDMTMTLIAERDALRYELTQAEGERDAAHATGGAE